MKRTDQRPANPSSDTTNSTAARPRGGTSPHAGEADSGPAVSESAPQLFETQQPVLVPATGAADRPLAGHKGAPRTGDRDLDVNGVEQDDDGQPGTGLGPDDARTDKEL
jgi:hypothetical protein